VLLHRLLYEIDDMQRGLFHWSDRDPTPRKLLRCLKRDVAFGSEVRDWREVQANMGMAALLMPKPVFTTAVRQGRESLGVSDRSIEAGSTTQEQLVILLAQRFRVSKQAARIRLNTLGITQPASQRSF
jgi:Zn-dependent peptidase ImmA (M78 family)